MSYWNYRECYDDEITSGGTPDDEPRMNGSMATTADEIHPSQIRNLPDVARYTGISEAELMDMVRRGDAILASVQSLDDGPRQSWVITLLTPELKNTCPKCGCGMESRSLVFLHEQLHAEPWEGISNALNLHSLSFALLPRVAKLMQDYADAERKTLIEQNVALRALIWHCQVHSGYRDCGYGQMTTEQKRLYDSLKLEANQ